MDHDKNGRKYWKIVSSEKKVAKMAIDKVKPALEKVVQAQEKADKKRPTKYGVVPDADISKFISFYEQVEKYKKEKPEWSAEMLKGGYKKCFVASFTNILNSSNAVMGAVAVGGPDAGAVVLSKIAEIQAKLQTAKRSQIDEYLKAKKKQGLFKKPLKAKGYLIQNARADAIAIRGSKSVANQQQKNQVIDYFKLTGHHIDP